MNLFNDCNGWYLTSNHLKKRCVYLMNKLRSTIVELHGLLTDDLLSLQTFNNVNVHKEML
ncbi:hypothetical protein KUC3_06590 [Alteromonas sp. KC3]|nr:hypothetical protein KUC3_06590 [Alteromonas sp. KC3]BCO21763.1 hypothetical protein KUC14_06320 [Alteromonas sp. KC14]